MLKRQLKITVTKWRNCCSYFGGHFASESTKTTNIHNRRCYCAFYFIIWKYLIDMIMMLMCNHRTCFYNMQHKTVQKKYRIMHKCCQASFQLVHIGQQKRYFDMHFFWCTNRAVLLTNPYDFYTESSTCTRWEEDGKNSPWIAIVSKDIIERYENMQIEISVQNQKNQHCSQCDTQNVVFRLGKNVGALHNDFISCSASISSQGWQP